MLLNAAALIDSKESYCISKIQQFALPVTLKDREPFYIRDYRR